MNRINLKTFSVLSLIIFIGIILRVWMFGNVPPSLNWDEVSLGYNAYSILQTGRDEYGEFFPIITKSLGDFKPALYVYLIIPFIKIFGLNELSVRFPALLFGSITILTTYFLTLELFKKRNLALISSFLIAISPWSIQFSRYASEAMVGLSFNLLMILFFLKGLRKPWMLFLSIFFGSLSLYIYQNEKVFVPLLVISMVLIFRKEIYKIQKKYLISGILFGVLLILPLMFVTFTNKDTLSRARDTSFINKPNGIMTDRLTQKLYYADQNNDFLGKIFDNRRIVYGKEILNNYLSHFDINYLFLKGDINPRHKAPGMGQLYLVELPFLLLGLYFLIFGKFKKESITFLITWILIVPISAAITWEVPHAIRTLNFLPTFQILIALGILCFYEYVKGKKWHLIIKYSIYLFIILVSVFNFLYYFNQYFVQYRILNSSDWQYGYAQIVPEINKLYENYDQIIVSDEKPFDQSYIFFLFYLKYPPEKFIIGDHSQSHNFDKFIFRKITSEDLSKNNTKILFIGRPGDFQDDSKTLKTIYFLNGEEMGKIVKGG